MVLHWQLNLEEKIWAEVAVTILAEISILH